jgi:hypothetical protein
MTILLDIHGVLVTTPGWRIPQFLPDGFMEFNPEAARNLATLYSVTNADIVLTTTHRISYSIDKWHEIFKARGLSFHHIAKVNNKTLIDYTTSRGQEIEEWVGKFGMDMKFIAIDDDTSINSLPAHIRNRCVLTKSLLGFNKEALAESLTILNMS